MQVHEERHQGSRLCRTQILAVRRHIATTLDDLADELVLRKSYRDYIERRPALPSTALQGVTVVALLGLKHERPLPLQRAAPLHVLRRNRLATPRIHRGAP